MEGFAQDLRLVPTHAPVLYRPWFLSLSPRPSIPPWYAEQQGMTAVRITVSHGDPLAAWEVQ